MSFLASMMMRSGIRKRLEVSGMMIKSLKERYLRPSSAEFAGYMNHLINKILKNQISINRK